MVMIENYAYPNGLKLLSSWQSGDPKSRETMKEIFDAAIQGEFDKNFSLLATNDGGRLHRKTKKEREQRN